MSDRLPGARAAAVPHRARLLAPLALCAAAACVAPPPARPAPAAVIVVTADEPLPPSARMDDIARLRDTVRSVLDRAVADSAFPGAVAVIGTSEGILATYGAGVLDREIPVRPDEHTIWDLASLTKVVALTSAMMQLVDEGAIDLDAPVQRYLPEWTGDGKERVTVRHLLTHSSGLPAWRPLYKEAEGPDGAVALALATPLDTVPGARTVYSDLGIIIAGKLVERVAGTTLDAFVRERVFGPLGMTSTGYRPDPSLRARIAPTEFDPWRQRQPHGEVHDENAFALGGVSAHAGLFSTGRDLARFAQAYLAGGALGGVRLASRETIERFTALQDSALSNRAIGWEKPTGRNSAGTLMSPHAFGHT
ncbi:MAG TPA: serine hydrolase domain-containing protein, partial [Gemmatimonadaceae bacterium]